MSHISGFRNVLASLVLCCSPFVMTQGLNAAEPSGSVAGLPLVVHETFDEGAEDWDRADPTAWKLETKDGAKVLSLIKKKSNYEPPVRSPYNQALLKDKVFTDTVLTVRLQSTSEDYGHRSLCLFFGYQDPSHFYYVHFGKKTDDHANQIFIVDGKPRTKISTKTTPGTNWDDNWHTARVVRRVETGEIAIYFDDMETPVMTATDKTFTSGRIGVGSFDDPGSFDIVTVHGNLANDN